MKVSFLLAAFLTIAQVAHASNYSQVDADILNSAFNQIPANPPDPEWVKTKLQHSVDVDQYMRKYSSTPYDQEIGSLCRWKTRVTSMIDGLPWASNPKQTTSNALGLYAT